TFITGVRMHLNPDDGDVEQVLRRTDVPVLFIAGGADRRMPPDVARRLYEATRNPLKKMVVIPGAGHGEAFSVDKKQYLDSVFRFFVIIRRGQFKGSENQ